MSVWRSASKPQTTRWIFAVLCLGAAAHAAVFHVNPADPSADDGNSGAMDAPFKTVQAAADRVRPGDTVYLHAGTYRQQFIIRTSGTEHASITFAAAPGDEGKVIFKGTEVVTNAAAATTARGETLTIPYERDFSICIPGNVTNRVLRDEVDQVFVDGKLLQAVEEHGFLRPGCFWVDRAAQPQQLSLMLPESAPRGSSTIEVSRLQWAIRFEPRTPAGGGEPPRSKHIILRGLSFFGFATHPRCPAISFKRCDHMRLEDCTVEWCNAAGIGLTYSRDLFLIRNVVRHCGQVGIDGGKLERITLEDNVTSFNNTKFYSVWWGCGGMKLCRITDSVIRRHVAVGNHGEGIWLDWECSNNTVEDCLAAYNIVAGFLNEVAPGNVCRRNIFAFNRVIQGSGLAISGSSDTIVENNIFYGNEGAAVDIGGGPGQRPYGDDFVQCNDNRVVRNLVVSNSACVAFAAGRPGYMDRNVVDHNLYWGWQGEQPMVLAGRPTSLAQWRAATTNDIHSLIADPHFADPLRFDFTLPADSPAFQVGFSTEGMRLDWSSFAVPPPAPGVSPRPVGHTFCVDLTPYFNRSLRDENPGDGQGGWTDQGPNDLRNLPVGMREFEGVPFRIGTGQKAAVALRSRKVRLPAPENVEIPIGRKARALYFLHTAAWASADTLCRYVIQAGDDVMELTIRDGRELMDWWNPMQWREADILERHHTFPAWQGANAAIDRITVYATRWENPTPETAIDKVIFAMGDGRAAVFLLAITGEE